MSPPLTQNLSVTRGDDDGGTITFDQPCAGFNEIWFTVRTAWATTETDNTGAVFSGTLTGGEVIVTGTYTATIDLPSVDTLTWTNNVYFYDVQVRTTGGKIYTTQVGQLRMIPDATRGG